MSNGGKPNEPQPEAATYMSGMTNNTRRANTGKPGNKGKFDGKNNSGPETGLPAEPQPLVIPIITHVELKTALYPDLPDWPETLPEPEVYFELGNGRVETSITTGSVDFKVWSSDDDHYNSLNYNYGSEKKTGWSESEEEAAIEWANAVHDRIDMMTYSATLATVQGDVQRAITAQATDKPYTPNVAPVYTAEELATNAPKRGAIRAEGILSRWFAEKTGDTQGTTPEVLQDALTDLMHWADAQDIDFTEAIGRAAFVHADEVKSPEF